MTARYNVVIVGKTGVGKSALVNYLYGDKVAETGVGKPVTNKGFHHINFVINGLPVRIFDSWGLELGKDEEWMDVLQTELEKRGTDKSPTEWFHSVFYCISASSHRIEDFDTKIINQFLKERYKVTVIFTKSDLVSDAEAESLKDELRRSVTQEVPIISCCSEEKILRGGLKTQQFGRKAIELQAYNDFWESMSLRLPYRCEKVLTNLVDEWYSWREKGIEAMVNNRLKLDEIYELLQIYTRTFTRSLSGKNGEIIKKISQEIETTLSMYGEFAEALNYPPASLKKVGTLDFDVRFASYRHTDLTSVISAFFDFSNISYGSYTWNIKNELRKLNRSPQKRKREMIANLKLVTNKIKREMKSIKPQVKRIINDIRRQKAEDVRG